MKSTKQEVKCPNCGMPESEWENPEGYSLEGEKYCCKGCAEGTGCECE